MDLKRKLPLKIILGFIFLILLLYNFKIANDYKYEAGGDASDYIHLSLNLAKTGNYGHVNTSKEAILDDFKADRVKTKDFTFTKSTAFRPPVWPILISGIFLIFDYNITYVIIFKFLLHILGLFIFYRTLKILKLQEIIIIIGTFLYGINPAWQLYSRVFLSEPITFFFITLWVYLLIRFVKLKSGFLPQAVVGGIIILSHPYYIFLPFFVWLVVYLKKEMKLKMFFASSLICAAMVSTWIIRNLAIWETDKIVLTTSSGAVMAKGWNQDVPEMHTNTKGDLADESLVLENYNFSSDKTRNEVERMELYKDATFHFIKTNPDLILPIIWKKLKSAFNPLPETPKPGLLETSRVIFQVLSLFALLYLIFFSRHKLLQSLAVSLILSTIAITIITYSGFRFRMPQVGIELLIIIYVIDDILKMRRKKKSLKGKQVPLSIKRYK